jgi:hypothetical protein
MPASRQDSSMTQAIPFVCPHCGRASHHPEDKRHRFCANPTCGFVDDIPMNHEIGRLLEERHPGEVVWHDGMPQLRSGVSIFDGALATDEVHTRLTMSELITLQLRRGDL